MRKQQKVRASGDSACATNDGEMPGGNSRGKAHNATRGLGWSARSGVCGRTEGNSDPGEVLALPVKAIRFYLFFHMMEKLLMLTLGMGVSGAPVLHFDPVADQDVKNLQNWMQEGKVVLVLAALPPPPHTYLPLTPSLSLSLSRPRIFHRGGHTSSRGPGRAERGGGCVRGVVMADGSRKRSLGSSVR
jgi:hypothetical protein